MTWRFMCCVMAFLEHAHCSQTTYQEQLDLVAVATHGGYWWKQQLHRLFRLCLKSNWCICCVYGHCHGQYFISSCLHRVHFSLVDL